MTRDHVEDGGEHVGGDREVGQRRMQRLARPAPQPLERAAFERERRADRELPHYDSLPTRSERIMVGLSG